MLQEDILKQNEIRANRVSAIILLISIGVYILSWILFEVEYFYAYVSYRPLIITCIMLLLITDAICLRFKFEPGWVKLALLGSLTVSYALTMSLLTFYVTIFMVVPMVLSVRYFSKRLTETVAFGSIIIFFFAFVYGANHGLPDLNLIVFEPGTVINIIGDGWLDESTLDTPYRMDGMLRNSIFMFGIRLFPVAIVAYTCIKVTEHGRRVMLEQVRSAEENTRISSELDLAKRIQADMLPNIFPAFPERDEFDLYAFMEPAREVGGDFYDFFLVDEDHLAMLIADVSGKGVPAAMFMMFSKNIVANNLMMKKSPGRALSDTCRAISKNNGEDMFFTIWVGVLTISTGRLVCANAGHEYPIIRRNGGDFEIYKDPHGISIGWIDDEEYDDYELMLLPGDQLFVYTDGVTEASDADENMFGMERIPEVLNNNPNATPKELIEAVKNALDDFTGDAQQNDDTTMLAFSFGNKGAE